MLQQILKDMYIEPDLLEALNEDQKKTLFLKMRQEQVRRWKEREEKMEKEEAHRPKPKPKTGNSKNVSWLLGRDGDVQVVVIGEVDELKTSKLIYPGLGERNTSSLHNNSRPSLTQPATFKSNLINRSPTDSTRSGRENLPPKTQAGIQLNLKDNTEEVRTSPPLQVASSEQKPSTDNVAQPREPQEDAESGRSARAPSPPPSAYRPHLRPVSTATPSAPLSAASLLKALDRSSIVSGSSSSSTSISTSGGGGSGLLGGPAHASAASLLKASDRSGSTGSSGGSGGLSAASWLKTPDRIGSASGSGGGSSSSGSSSSGSIGSSGSGDGSSGLLGGTAHFSTASLLKTSDRSGGSGGSSGSGGSGGVGGLLGGPSCKIPTAQPQDPQSSRGKEFRVVAASKRAVSVDEEGAASALAAGGADACVGRGRVAQLMKTFSVCGETSTSSVSAAPGSHAAPPARSSKPPIPCKPSHLRLQQAASLR